MIKSGTFNFLKLLAANNNREWFLANKDLYEDAKNNVLDFVTALISGLSKLDPAIPADLKAKDCVMRIYRDVRFSKNKAPYKSNFGIAISPNGKNFNGPGFYIHLQPGKSFVAAGSWMPHPEHLKAIRQEIDYNGEEFRGIVENSVFKTYFKALDIEDKLKTAPKGYPADHDDIEYLKLKSFTVSHPVKDSDLTSSNAIKKVVDIAEKVQPFIEFLRNAIA